MLRRQTGLPQAFRIAELRQENLTARTLVLDGAIEAAPGQFIMAWLPGVDERPFSLAWDNPASLTIAAVGPFSRALHALAVGDTVWLRGPLGQGYRLPWSGEPVGHHLLVGGGYGVAPLMFLADRLMAAGQAVSLVIGARSASELLLPQVRNTPLQTPQAIRDSGWEIAESNLKVWLATEDGSRAKSQETFKWPCLQGLVTDALQLAIQDSGRPAMVYGCGPTGMLRALAAYCAVEGLPVQLSWEAPMRCGIGLCGSCEIGSGWLACLDGPVFPFDPEQRLPHQG